MRYTHAQRVAYYEQRRQSIAATQEQRQYADYWLWGAAVAEELAAAGYTQRDYRRSPAYKQALVRAYELGYSARLNAMDSYFCDGAVSPPARPDWTRTRRR